MLSLIAKLKKQKEAEEEKHRQNEETARIYAQYVKSFDGKDADESMKFVRSDVFDPATGTSDSAPAEIVSLGPKDQPETREDNEELSATYLSQIQQEEQAPKKPPKPSKVREIDTFIEELKEKQRVMNERKELHKRILTATTEYERYEISQKLSKIDSDPTISPPELSSTNIYLGNLSPNVTDEVLRMHFAKFGQIVGIRVMPLKNDSGFRPVTSAFISFMTHEQAEMAKNAMDGVEILNLPCKIGWAKNLIKPNFTQQFVPQSPFLPMPVPFNAVPPPAPVMDAHLAHLPIFQVFTPIPNHRKRIIDLMSKYVSEAGEEFEQLIMEKETPNGLFSFLFEKFTPESVYYRWRVYSFLQGDTLDSWRSDAFKITSFGKTYNPPPAQSFETADASKFTNVSQSGYVPLSPELEKNFESIIQNTTTTRNDVCNAMLFIINNSESAYHLTDLLINHFLQESLQVNQKIALLYVLSDVLYNSSSSRQYAWIYRTAIERRLPEIFDSIKQFKLKSTSKIASQQLIDAILKLLKVWEEWTVYTPVFTKGLEATLLGDDIGSFMKLPEFEDYRKLLGSYDGENLDYFEVLATLPLKYREDAHKYLLMGFKELKSLCLQRGLLLSPSDRPTLVLRLVIYDKYQFDKRVAEERNRELLRSKEPEPAESEGSDMEGSDMDQESDEVENLHRTKLQEATVKLQKALMKRTLSPRSQAEPSPEAQSEPESPGDPDQAPEPEAVGEPAEDDIDDIFAS